ncbi:DUF1697 domain-containing protein [soil metagenome]
MSTRVILLRAVNVGGATLPMAELRSIMTELGASEVRTYIASGNAVCELDGDPAEFDRALEKAIEKEFGFFRESISRTPAELEKALAAHPFEVIEPKYSYVNFLTAEPTATAIEKARGYPVGDDRWEVIGREQHIRFADGAGRPQMNAAGVGKALGVPGTARNLRTVQALIDLAKG